MPDPQVTVVSYTGRPGGVDIFLAGMRDQTFPRDQFEVVLVDRRYERRHQEVMDLARAYGVRLIHVPEHRRDGRWAVTSSAINTGFALARGRVILLLVDWTYAPPGWIEAHLELHDGPPTYGVAPYYYHAVGITEPMYKRLAKELRKVRHTIRPWSVYANQPKLRMKIPVDLSDQDDRANVRSMDYDAVLRGEVFDEMSVFEDGFFSPAWLPRMPPLPDGDPGLRYAAVDFAIVHLKNESMLRETAYKLNGTDIWSERGGRMSIDTEFGWRLHALGVKLAWGPKALAHCVNPRHGICRVTPCGDTIERVGGRWNLADCQAFVDRRRVEIAAGFHVPAPAPYTMEGLAEKLEPWRTADVIDTSRLDVPDTEFFGREIWPDSPY